MGVIAIPPELVQIKTMKKILSKLFPFLFTFPAIAETNSIVPQLDNFEYPKPSQEYDQKLLQDLKAIGWHHVHIEGDTNEPAYAFSLGFYANYNQPEIIVFGLQPEIAQQLLNVTAVSIAGNGSKYEMYKGYSDIAEGTKIGFIPVVNKYIPEYLGYGKWLYQSKLGEFPVIQMVWPDKQGNLPWEPEFDDSFVKYQPMLDK